MQAASRELCATSFFKEAPLHAVVGRLTNNEFSLRVNILNELKLIVGQATKNGAVAAMISLFY
jgi:hypothetical protein